MHVREARSQCREGTTHDVIHGDEVYGRRQKRSHLSWGLHETEATPEGRCQNLAAVIKRSLQVLCGEQQDGV